MAESVKAMTELEMALEEFKERKECIDCMNRECNYKPKDKINEHQFKAWKIQKDIQSLCKEPEADEFIAFRRIQMAVELMQVGRKRQLGGVSNV